jgi:hypothetical protein
VTQVEGYDPRPTMARALVHLVLAADEATGRTASHAVPKYCVCCGENDAQLHCSRCGAYYCRKTHQRAHWPLHKLVCGKKKV